MKAETKGNLEKVLSLTNYKERKLDAHMVIAIAIHDLEKAIKDLGSHQVLSDQNQMFVTLYSARQTLLDRIEKP